MESQFLGRSDVRRLLRQSGVRAERRYGQNFLADPNIVRRILRVARVQPDDYVLEVGVGLGSLTVGLVGVGAHVLGVELDERLATIARDLTPSDLVQILVSDATRLDWSTLLREPHFSGDEDVQLRTWKMVSNLPYSVGTRVVINLLDSAPQIKKFIIMVQREVGERFVAKPGGKLRSLLSLKVEYHCETEVVGRISPEVFIPSPDVESVLLMLQRRNSPPVGVDEAHLFRVIETAFRQRRKTLRRSLASKWSKDFVEDTFSQTGLDGSLRPEQLSLTEFAALGEALPQSMES